MNNLCRVFWQLLYRFSLIVEERNIYNIYTKLRKNDELAVEDITKLQLKKLKEILCYAQENIPYYQKTFAECGFDAWKFSQYEDLEKIPYIDKSIVQQYAEDFLALGVTDQKIERKTGGSTGNKLKIYYSKQSLDVTAAVVVRCLEWAGKKIGDKEIHFSSNVNIHIPWKDYLRERAKCIALHRKNIVLDTLDVKDYDRILLELKSYNPVVVQGFPSIGYALACYAEKFDKAVEGDFQVYESTGERLFDFQREKIEKVFGCKVFNRYGNAEFGVIAYECPEHDGMHVQGDVVYAETPSIDGVNEIVVTTLTNKMMPLIRYRTGDLGTLTSEKCRCGLPYPRIINMEGRIHDFIHIDTGVILSTTFLLDLLDRYGGFNDFQVFYDAGISHLEFFLTPGEGLQMDRLKAFQKDLFTTIKGKAKVDIHLIPKLKLLPSGKFRYVINDRSFYHISGQDILYDVNMGRIDKSTECNIFPVLSGICCLEGFYDIERYPQEVFIWGKGSGCVQFLDKKETIELLSLSSEKRTITFYNNEGNVCQNISLQEGWNEYKLSESVNGLIYFVVDKPIPKNACNNDSRKLAFGLREKR